MKRFAGFLILLMLTFLSGCLIDNEINKDTTLTGVSKVEIGNVIKLDANETEEMIWSSSSEAVAMVIDGYVFGLSEGRTMISATLVSNPDIIKSKLITVVKSSGPNNQIITITGNRDVEINKSTVLKTNSTVAIKWVSSNPEVAAIDSNGKVDALSVGTSVIFAYDENDFLNYGTFEIEVVNKRLEIYGPTEIGLREQLTLKAEEGYKVVWLSSNETIIKVDLNGNLTALDFGTATITAYDVSNRDISGSITITVVPPKKGIDNSYSYQRTKILSINEARYQMELLDVDTVNYTVDTEVLKLVNGETKPITIQDLYIGMDNVYVEVGEDTKTISRILVDGEPKFSNIRVAIRKTIDDIANVSTLYHDRVTFTLSGNTVLKTFDNSSYTELSNGSRITITINSSGFMQVRLNNYTIITTNKRIIFSANDNQETSFTSITRASRVPTYADNLEVSVVNGKLLVVNDIDLEKYLTKVVPSEMPSSWNLEALKAQAVAARTYAYMDILNKANDQYGYTVDDSTKSQVYNNTNPQASTNQAILETKGKIMMNGEEAIQAYYYSSSSGLTASAHEVWIKDGVTEPVPYLIGQNLTKDSSNNPLQFDYQSEASMLQFFKTIKMYTPDLNSTYHRWKVTMTYEQLTTTINTNIKVTYASTPQLVLTKEGENYVSKALPESIGNVNDIYVSERGTSGVVVSIDIVTTTGTYRIVNQYNIRFTIRPKDAGSTVRRYYAKYTDSDYVGNATGDSILLSGFFAIEKVAGELTFYGGGNGHGVGMSQYGANGLANEGYNFIYILNTYYSQIDLVDITNNYVPLGNFRDYFK